MSIKIEYYVPNYIYDDYFGFFSSWITDAVPTGCWKMVNSNDEKITMYMEVEYEAASRVDVRKKLFGLIPYTTKETVYEKSTAWISEKCIRLTEVSIYKCSK